MAEKLNELDVMKDEDEDLLNISDAVVEKNLKMGKDLIKDIPIDKTLDAHQNLEIIREKTGITCKWGADDRYQISHDGSVWRCCWMNLEESFSNSYGDNDNPKLKVCTTRCSNLSIEHTKRGIY